MTIYFPAKEFYFLHVPKAGGTSVRHWLLHNGGESIITKHATYRQLQKHTKQKDVAHFIITRNPYERMHSWYYYHIKKAHKWKHKPNRHSNWLLIEPKGFNWFVQNTDWYKTDIGKKQVNFTSKKSRLFLCKLENIDEDIKPVRNYLNLNVKFPKVNVSDKPDWKSEYDTASKELIKTWYQKDFDEFDYDTEF